MPTMELSNIFFGHSRGKFLISSESGFGKELRRLLDTTKLDGHEFGRQWHIVSYNKETLCGVKLEHDQIAVEVLRSDVCDECLKKLDPSVYELTERKLHE